MGGGEEEEMIYNLQTCMNDKTKQLNTEHI